MSSFGKSSLSRYIFSRMAGVLLLVLIGASILIAYNQHTKSQYQERIGELREKRAVLIDFSDHLMQIFFREKGFLADQSPADYDAIEVEKGWLNEALATYRGLPLIESESKLAAQMEQFSSLYFTDYLPKVIQAARNNNNEALRSLTGNGILIEAENLIRATSQQSRFIDEQLGQGYSSLFTTLSDSDLLFLGFVVLLILVYAWVTWLISRNIATPLRQLSGAARRIAAGEYMHPEVYDRKDEIGHISRSIQHMMQELQAKEEELIAQNEELIAQQDELQMQQEELEAALHQAEQNESDKQRLYEESETQRKMTIAILDTVHEGIQFVDEQGLLRYVNLSMYELFSVGRVSYVDGLPIERFYRTAEKKVDRSHQLITFMEDRIHDHSDVRSYEFLYEIADPERRIVLLYTEHIYSGGRRLGTVFVHRDITKEYEVDRMKSEFVSTVSHELRTPLSSVLGFAELLLTKELKPERQHRYLKMIHQEAIRLTGLINDFLDLQRMESGRQTYNKRQMDVAAVIREVVDMLRATTDKHEFHVQIGSEHPLIWGDPDKLTQVFTNLIGNAIKYSPDGGTITVNSVRTEREVAVSVADEGLGIPKDAISNLFTKFYRIDNSDRREIGGTGLGLAIVKEIVKAHQGDIRVSSKLGSGSTFTVTLPLAVRLADDGPTTDLEDDSGYEKPRKIVIIEDDDAMIELLEGELRSHGFRVSAFHNGQEALEAIRKQKPDVVVLDIMLKHSIDGWTVIRELKESKEMRDIPIIVSSALDEKEMGRTLGAGVYLVKPYPPSLLSRAILKLHKTGEGPEG